jgi:uncharacterized oxidoreductase
MTFTDRTVLITGAGTGIGLALAEELAGRGARVLTCGRTERTLRDAQARARGLEYLVADVTDDGDRQRLLDWVEAEHPETSVLINNAGIQRTADVRDGPGALKTGEVAVNLEAPVRLADRFLPRLLALAEAGRPAALVNVTSGLGYVPLASSPVYSATKAGLQAFTRALRVQLRGTGVEVVDLAPPAVDTALLRGAGGVPEDGKGGPPVIEPDEFARKAVRALEKGETEVRVGGANLLYVLGRLAPRGAVGLLSRLAS